jgi:hypothetical protein
MEDDRGKSCDLPLNRVSRCDLVMLARRLESPLAGEVMKTDLSGRAPDDVAQRFESLRGYRLLPAGRTKNATHLSTTQIVAAVLSLATVKPGYAGLAAKMLANLRPVGGIDASFQQSRTFGKAIERILESAAALDSLIEVSASDSEQYTNAHCRGAMIYRSGVSVMTSHYVGQTALALLRPGAEKDFDPRDSISSVVIETVFYPSFFQRISTELKRESSLPPMPVMIDPRDEDEEIQKEERAKRLGIKPNSRFLNLGIDNQVTWPSTETVVNFEGHTLILLPKTVTSAASVHIDLRGQQVTSEDAVTLINRFLSLLTWCDDRFSVVQNGWSGNPIPVAVPRRNLGSVTALSWIFDRKIPSSPEARKALAIYREGRNAEQNYLISYAVLCYYKIVELKYPSRGSARKWFGENYLALNSDEQLSEDLRSFENARGTENPGEYLYRACRVAVAHANEPYSSDPDDLHELRRLHVAAGILRALARRFIQNELGVSDSPYDGS